MHAIVKKYRFGKQFKGKWYIVTTSQEDPPPIGDYLKSKYLHKDGVWRDSTMDDKTKQFTGFFDTESEAIEVLRKENESGTL